jgi:hypothetical protein
LIIQFHYLFIGLMRGLINVLSAVCTESTIGNAQVFALLSTMQQEMRVMQQQHAQEREDMAHLKEELLNALRVNVGKTADATTKQVKALVDSENKKILTALATSRQEVCLSLSLFLSFSLVLSVCVCVHV